MITTVREGDSIRMTWSDERDGSQRINELTVPDHELDSLLWQLILIKHLEVNGLKFLVKQETTELLSARQRAGRSLLRLRELGLPMSPSLAATLSLIEVR
jgi:hypothetical protein